MTALEQCTTLTQKILLNQAHWLLWPTQGCKLQTQVTARCTRRSGNLLSREPVWFVILRLTFHSLVLSQERPDLWMAIRPHSALHAQFCTEVFVKANELPPASSLMGFQTAVLVGHLKPPQQQPAWAPLRRIAGPRLDGPPQSTEAAM